MKRVIFSILIYTGYILGIALVVAGYFFLHQDELSIARSIIGKQQSYNIRLITDESFQVNSVDVKEKNGNLYLVTPEGELPLFLVDRINGVDINREISQKLSHHGIKGIVLVVVGGFIFLLSFLFRDYL
ncbi:MAG: hypothetical protein GXO05_03660 [Aquificae bacterium]|nr:hypothetical protein [Aquificota bacterium]